MNLKLGGEAAGKEMAPLDLTNGMAAPPTIDSLQPIIPSAAEGPGSAASAMPAGQAGAAPASQQEDGSALERAHQDGAAVFDRAAREERLFDKVLNASEKAEDEILASDQKNLEEALQDLDITDDVERAKFMGAMKLKPLLESDIVYHAIAQEMASRGFKNGNDALRLSRNFSLLSKQDKREFVDNVIDRILYVLDDRVDLTNIKSLKNRANLLKTTEIELTQFLKTWKRLRESNYEEAKVVILDMLHRGNDNAFLARLKAAYKEVVGFNWFRSRPLASPLLKKQKPYDSALILDEAQAELLENEAFKTAALEKYLKATHPSMHEHFLERSFTELTRGQLQALHGWPLWASLSSGLKEKISIRKLRLDTLAEGAEKLQDAREELQALRLEIGNQDAAGGLAADPATTKNIIAQIRAARKSSDDDDTIEAMRTIVKENADRLPSASYAKVAKAILAQSEEFSYDEDRVVAYQIILDHSRRLAESDFVSVAIALLKDAKENQVDEGEILEVFRSLCGLGRDRAFGPASENAIKKAISAQVADFSYSENSAEAIGIIAEAWSGGRPARTLDEMKAREAELAQSLLPAYENALRALAATLGIPVHSSTAKR